MNTNNVSWEASLICTLWPFLIRLLFLSVCDEPLITDEQTTTVSYIHGCAKGEDVEFRPKYKYYEELRDPRKDKEIVMRFRQSPGVKRRREKAKVTTKVMTVRLTSDGATNNSVA